MAACGWGSDTPVIEWLQQEPWRFGFFQAVRIIERAMRSLQPLGEGGNPEHEALRLASQVNWAFPATEVARLRRVQEISFPGTQGDAVSGNRFGYVLDINCIGLAGALGPLPEVITQHLLDRARVGDTALKDFLDIFNHRLASLLYRLRCRLRPGFNPNLPADKGDMSQTMFCLAGMGTGGLLTPTPEHDAVPVMGRAGVPDASLFAFVGLLADFRRSMAGLETMLEAYFNVPVRGRQYQGAWLHVAQSDWSILGSGGERRGRNVRLGGTAVLGRRCWDPEAGFVLQIGPVNLENYLKFLPCGNGAAYESLKGLVRLYAGLESDVEVELRLRAEEVPELSLAKGHRQRLGFSTFLRNGRTMTRDGILHYRLSGKEPAKNREERP